MVIWNSFYFHPDAWGRWTQFNEHNFWDGWFKVELCAQSPHVLVGGARGQNFPQVCRRRCFKWPRWVTPMADNGDVYGIIVYITPLKTDISPKNWWLEDEMFFSNGPFSGNMLILGWLFVFDWYTELLLLQIIYSNACSNKCTRIWPYHWITLLHLRQK